MQLRGTFPSALEQCLFKVFELCSHARVSQNREPISLHSLFSVKKLNNNNSVTIFIITAFIAF